MNHSHICVTGGTGFVGQEVISKLLENGYHVRALVRTDRSSKKLSQVKQQYPSKLEFVLGDATEPNDVIRALDGCDALIHLVGTKREESKRTGLNYVDVDLASALASAIAMQRSGIKRILFLSAGAIGNSEYIRTKAKAEQAIMEPKLDWTIFRPAFIVGPGQQWPVLMGPFLWLLGLSPGKLGDTARRAGNITREVLAQSFIIALKDDRTIGKILEVPDLKKMMA
ncbi:MAG: NAD(P)H-binding protein [Bacteroidota bacterium]|nr:NAD(P)H-binding protein [Bacteroidota bacterium]MDP4235870.1 NAD(P)H-binding protein [Bacteroidota bacterium]